MIARVWRGRTKTADAGSYDHHYRVEVLSRLRQVPGFCEASLLRRDLAGETEFMSVVLFEDLDAIRRFAGDDYETAVIADEARHVLVSFDDRVQHYDVAIET